MDINNLDKVVNEVIEEITKERLLNKDSGSNARLTASAGSVSGDFDVSLAARMEHSMIRPDATPAMVKQFCDEAVKYKFRNVALAPCFVPMAAGLLKGTGVKVSTAVAFPMGIASTKIKVAETIEVIENGAAEIDLPINIGMIKAGQLKAVKEDVEAVVTASNKRALIKVVIDLGALTEEERIKAALIAKMADADFLKIAATTRPVGVNAEDMRFFRQIVGNDMGLKADGGIKDYNTALSIIESGGSTIGASGSVKIVKRVF
ncbi:deoxyribose-phosphate aldolase [Anaerobacterium chartisolvens]|uniref:Deoxyribose-phosphate aldolase n=1 Tax=Anaerobacterium chartisolvens TaxID=1297424 RepID=A0A369B9B1_9FIRM|nr:deoxyribose-phosphate aldolase [Anaerobacterium chartisolvens]RCX18001.1 deoxyribose-phosphate aldolase [Anaerobacterium chartisolvens]